MNPADDRGLFERMTEREIVLVVVGSIRRGDVEDTCRRASELLGHGRGDLLVCDVGALSDPDLASIDALARLQLSARRLGYRVRMRGACADLLDLLDFFGLGDVLSLDAPLRLEPGGQAEEREEALGVEEEADPGDPAV